MKKTNRFDHNSKIRDMNNSIIFIGDEIQYNSNTYKVVFIDGQVQCVNDDETLNLTTIHNGCIIINSEFNQERFILENPSCHNKPNDE